MGMMLCSSMLAFEKIYSHGLTVTDTAYNELISLQQIWKNLIETLYRENVSFRDRDLKR